MKKVLLGLVVTLLMGASCSSITQKQQDIQKQNNVRNYVINSISVGIKFSSAEVSLGISNRHDQISYRVDYKESGKFIIDEKNISEEEFDRLEDLINKNNFWDFNEKYTDENLVYGIYYEIGVASCGDHTCGPLDDIGRHVVTCYAGACPAELMEIIDEMKDLWGYEISEEGL